MKILRSDWGREIQARPPHEQGTVAPASSQTAQFPTVSTEPPPHHTCHLDNRACHTPRPSFCFAESPPSFKSCEGPKTKPPEPRRKVPGISLHIGSAPFEGSHCHQTVLNISFSFSGLGEVECLCLERGARVSRQSGCSGQRAPFWKKEASP